MRTIALTLIVVVSLLHGAPGAQAPALGKRPGTPNILLIQADDLGYGDLSVYGQARFRTPSLDRMAREGVRFTQYYAGSTVCAPSRAALMTGLHMGHAPIRGNSPRVALRPQDVTVATLLREAGYRTALIGKWGLGGAGTTGEPNRQGFDHYYGFLEQPHAHRQYTTHLWKNGARIVVDAERDYVNDLFTRETARFIGTEDARPFFIHLNYTVPHAELRAPADAMAAFRDAFPEQPFVNQKADAQTEQVKDEVTLGYRSQPTPRAAFAAMIARMDRDIGTLLDLLKARGIDERTLVIFTSDNGPHREGGGDPEFFNSSGGLRGIKRDLYEGGIRVPMIARWPGTIPAGRTTDYISAHWDVLPTLMDLAGAKAPAGLDGVSLARVMRGETQPPHEFMYWEFHERGFQQAVRMGGWKAVRRAHAQPLELYDLERDPREERNVASENAAIVRQIEAYLAGARTDSPHWPPKTTEAGAAKIQQQ